MELKPELCDKPDCVGEVGKFGPYYLKYIGNALSKKAIPARFFDEWDQAIVTQMLEKNKSIKTIKDLRETDGFKKIQAARERWLEDARNMGLTKWKEEVTTRLKQKGNTDRAIRKKIRNALRYKELQLKF